MILETSYRAPKVTGVDAWGKDVALRGWTVLYFYPKDMTPGCTTQANEFQTSLELFENLGCSVIGVSKDSCERHQKFADKEGLRFTLLSDAEGRLCEEFGVWKEKMNYGKKYMGIERSTFVINPEGNVVAQWLKVKVAGHVADVLETVQSLRKIKRPTK